MTKKELQDAGTAFLKTHGCTSCGREKSEVDSKQTNFERSKMRPSPMGGQPPRR